MRRWCVLLPILLLALVGDAGARAAADPIEGVWTGSSGAKITIRATSSTHFVGTVTVAYRSGNGCLHPVGQAVWEIDKDPGGDYTGINHGFSSAAGCPDEKQPTSWEVSDASLQVCVVGYACATVTRLVTRSTPTKAVTRLTVREIHNRYRPSQATVTNGAIITICNAQDYNAIPFSLNGYGNAFNVRAAGSYHNGVPKGVRVLRAGQCMKVTAKNPTTSPILFKIYDGIHSQARLMLTVMPSRS